MGAIRSKASSVKSAAISAEVPTMTSETGRFYVNKGKKTLNDDSEKIVNRVDDLQDTVEDLRKDVVSRGVRPLPRQLEAVAKEISVTTGEVKKLQDFLKKEKPVWTKIWEQELQMVMEDREMLTMQEELALDLQDDLEKLSETFGLVEQATKQQNVSNSDKRSTSGRNMHAAALDTLVDPAKAKDGMLNEVRALHPNHESRLEAIERAEKARQKELESRKGTEFQRELGNFVEEGKLKKSGGVEEVERQRIAKDERIRKEVFELQAKRALEAEARRQQKAEARRQAQAAAAAAAAEEKPAEGEAPKTTEETAEGEATEEKKEEQAPTENGAHHVAILPSASYPQESRPETLSPASMQDGKVVSDSASPLRKIANPNTYHVKLRDKATVTTFAGLYSQSSENMLVKQMKDRNHASPVSRRAEYSNAGPVASKACADVTTRAHVQFTPSSAPTLRAQQSTPTLRKTRSFWNSITGLAGW